METLIKDLKFKRVKNTHYNIYYWENVEVFSGAWESTKIKLFVNKGYIGKSIGYSCYFCIGDGAYLARYASFRVSGSAKVSKLKKFGQIALKKAKQKGKLMEPIDYINLYRNL